MNITDSVVDAQRELKAFLALGEATLRATDDPHAQLEVCGQVIARLAAETIEAYALALLLALRVQQLEGEREAVPGLAAMRPLM